MFQSFKNYGIFLLIALFVGTVLLSQKAGINVLLHPDLSKVISTEKIYCHGIIYNTCSVRLTTSISKQEDYQEILQLLSDAKHGDQITFYLAGNGGSVDTTIQLYNAIKNTNAHVTMVLEGSVYSAHAYIALMGQELIVGDYIIFMLHRSSGYGHAQETCAQNKGQTDRTQDLEKKCMEYQKAFAYQDESIVRGLLSKILTPAEIKKVLEGFDVLLTGAEVKSRLAGNKPVEVLPE